MHAALAAARAEVQRPVIHIHSYEPIGESRVELTLETSGREQIDIVKRRLIESGYQVEERRG